MLLRAQESKKPVFFQAAHGKKLNRKVRSQSRVRFSLEALGSIPQLALLTKAPHYGNCIFEQLCTYTYLFLKHKAKVKKHITNRGSSLKLLAGGQLIKRISAVTANFSLNRQQTLVHVALAGCWFSPLSHVTQSHKGQRHFWPSKKPSPHYAIE